MWRGIERILQGRDPREAWLFTQRFCGVCTTVHAHRLGARGRERAAARDAAQRAVHPEPDPGRARAARSHRPLLPAVGARLGRRHLGAEGRSGEGRRARREPLGLAGQRTAQMARRSRTSWKDFVASGQLGIFTNGYWGHPAMKLSPEVNLLAVVALPAGARVPAQGQPGRGDPRRQDAATSRTSPSAASRTPSTSTTDATLNMDRSSTR